LLEVSEEAAVVDAALLVESRKVLTAFMTCPLIYFRIERTPDE
jgi:hypothetical protein